MKAAGLGRGPITGVLGVSGGNTSKTRFNFLDISTQASNLLCVAPVGRGWGIPPEVVGLLAPSPRPGAQFLFVTYSWALCNFREALYKECPV